MILLEWGWRAFYGWNQKRKAVKELCAFFLEWETDINCTEPIPHPANGQELTKEVIQFVKHKYRLWRSQIVLSRWSKCLTDKQLEEVSVLLEGHQNSVIGILPEGRVMSQELYDRFFNEARKISWLKF